MRRPPTLISDKLDFAYSVNFLFSASRSLKFFPPILLIEFVKHKSTISLLRPTISSLWHWYLYSALVYAGFPGATQITSGKIVPLWFPKTRGRVMGAVTSGNNFGGFTMPALAASVIVFSGWELAYLIFGGIMLFLALSSYFIISESLEDVEKESIRTNRNLAVSYTHLTLPTKRIV